MDMAICKRLSCRIFMYLFLCCRAKTNHWGRRGNKNMSNVLKVILLVVVCFGLHPCKHSDCHTTCSTSPLQHSTAPSKSNLQNQISASLQKVTKCHLHYGWVNCCCRCRLLCPSAGISVYTFTFFFNYGLTLFAKNRSISGTLSGQSKDLKWRAANRDVKRRQTGREKHERKVRSRCKGLCWLEERGGKRLTTQKE